jgi:hypothetical protein
MNTGTTFVFPMPLPVARHQCTTPTRVTVVAMVVSGSAAIASAASQWFSWLSNKENSDAMAIAASGVVAWGAVHAASGVLGLLGISTGTRAPLPTLSGMATVVVASWAAHSAAVCTQQYGRQRRRNKSIPQSLRSAWQQRPAICDTSRSLLSFGSSSTNPSSIQPYRHTLRICLVGLLGFQLLGGRFWAVAPSSFTHLGSFARGSIAATEQYATSTQRQAIERLGRLWGCHTCGSRQLFRSLSTRSVQFICDHQPPKAVAYQLNQQWWRRLLHRPVAFRFFPQCAACSSRQGGLLSAATLELGAAKSWNHWWRNGRRVPMPSLQAAGSGRQAYVHGLRPRLHFGMGGILGLLATAEPDQGRARYRTLQAAVEAAWEQPPATWVRRQWAARAKPLLQKQRWYRAFSQWHPGLPAAPMHFLRR